MEKQIFDYIICGGGASGLLLLDALSGDSYFNTPSILLIEQEVKNSNDRTWCFWEASPGHFDPLLRKNMALCFFLSQRNLNLILTLSPIVIKCYVPKVFYQEIQHKIKSNTQVTYLKSKSKLR